MRESPLSQALAHSLLLNLAHLLVVTVVVTAVGTVVGGVEVAGGEEEEVEGVEVVLVAGEEE